MDLKKFIDKITLVEKKLNLNDLQVYGFNPWPLIRLRILNKYTNNDGKIDYASKKSFNKNKSKIKFIISYSKSILRYLANPLTQEKFEILYFTRQSESQDVVCDKPFNRYSDSFKHFFENEYKVKIVEVCDQEYVSDNINNVTSIDFLIKKIIVKCKFLRKTNFSKVLSFDQVNQEIKKEFNFHVDVQADLMFIYYLSKEFKKILRLCKPKLVFLTVFYRLEAMAMSLACQKLGIRVVEYQHGAQNDYHAMYTHWNNIPKKGYELIPDYFWMWGETSKKRITNWADKTTKHKAMVGGNIWVTFNRDRNINNENKLDYFIDGKINILISLQGDQFFPHFLFESIKNNTDDFMWYFRDHPRLPISCDLRNKILKLSNCEIKISSQVPLYELFKSIDIHITAYSSVAFEAQSFNIPTIFTHDNALNGYKELINKNGLFYAGNLDSFNELMISLTKSKMNIEPSYIVANLSIHTNALSLLME
jgi:hypothetical protein